MKKVSVLMVSGILILGLANVVYSQESGVSRSVYKIGIIDGKRIFEEHPDAKKAKEQLIKELKQKQKEINAMSAEIEKLEEDIESNLLLSDEERARMETKVDKKKQAALKYSQEAETYLNDKEEELTRQITEKVYLLIKQIAQEKGLSVVLENNYVLYAEDNLDITGDVLARIIATTKKERSTGTQTTR
ncbi:MAG: OmpH family outer membrane protein [bacterium]|nr:OmpH family outer membrane protein [bacterium]